MLVKYDVKFAKCSDGIFRTAKIKQTRLNDAPSVVKKDSANIEGILHKTEDGEYFFHETP